MVVIRGSASRCTTQDAKEARARALVAKFGSTEDAHWVGSDRLATVAKRPTAAIARSRKQTLPWLLDHLVCAQEQRLWNREAKRFGSFEIDHELESGGLLDRQIGGVGAS